MESISTFAKGIGMNAARVMLAVAGLMVVLTGCTNHVVHRERGYENLRQNDPVAAADDFRAAVEVKPSDYRSQYYLGLCLNELGQPIAAQAPLEQALTLRPEDAQWTPKIADALAESYFQQERYEALYGFLENMVQTYHQSTTDYLRQAKYMGLMGDADGQKTALHKAAFFAPLSDESPYVAIADFYLGVNDIENAVQAYKYAYFVNPSSEDVKNALRGLGIVPGPTIADAPPKPELAR